MDRVAIRAINSMSFLFLKHLSNERMTDFVLDELESLLYEVLETGEDRSVDIFYASLFEEYGAGSYFYLKEIEDEEELREHLIEKTMQIISCEEAEKIVDVILPSIYMGNKNKQLNFGG